MRVNRWSDTTEVYVGRLPSPGIERSERVQRRRAPYTWHSTRKSANWSNASMPTYEYACRACGEHLEAVQSFTDAPLTTCPKCGGELRKVFGSIGIVFKGSGFYKTDSRNSSSSTTPAASSSDSHGHDHHGHGHDHSHGGHDHSSAPASDASSTSSTSTTPSTSSSAAS
jgi:putative FmdB family regulatory protein